MIIWINGTFGVGKTETAKMIHKKMPNSYLYDPEELGSIIRKQIPVELWEEDFQDHEEWRRWNYHLLKKVTTETEKVVIVPMTLTNEQYYQEIIGRLTKEGIQIHHFTLVAEPQTRFTFVVIQISGEKRDTPLNELSLYFLPRFFSQAKLPPVTSRTS